MHRRLGVSLVLVGLTAIPFGTVSLDVAAAAGGAIEGSIKATGLASNGDAVVYIQQMPGSFPRLRSRPTSISDRCNSSRTCCRSWPERRSDF